MAGGDHHQTVDVAAGGGVSQRSVGPQALAERADGVTDLLHRLLPAGVVRATVRPWQLGRHHGIAIVAQAAGEHVERIERHPSPFAMQEDEGDGLPHLAGSRCGDVARDLTDRPASGDDECDDEPRNPMASLVKRAANLGTEAEATAGELAAAS